jgi:hypothetical protein
MLRRETTPQMVPVAILSHLLVGEEVECMAIGSEDLVRASLF